jgi:hypothetical protein
MATLSVYDSSVIILVYIVMFYNKKSVCFHEFFDDEIINIALSAK